MIINHHVGLITLKCTVKNIERILFLAFVSWNCGHLSLAEDLVVSIPDQQPFEFFHQRILPELPDVLSTGTQSLDSTFSWSNTYSSRTDSYFVDSESREMTMQYRLGLSDKVTFVTDIGARMVDGGITDSFIRSWDETLGASTSHRDHRGKNRFRIEGKTKSGGSFTSCSYFKILL